jgi:RND family efflux transporter MFP subunit
MKMKEKLVFLLSMICATTAFGSDEQPGKQITSSQGTPITMTRAETRDLEIWESSVGQLEAKMAPMIAAEVAGRLIAVNVDVGDEIQQGQLLAEIDAGDFELSRDMALANIDRLKALIKAQQLKVKRYRELIQKKSVNQSTLDDAEAQLGALKAQLASARVRLQQAQRNIKKTRITSPIDGYVDDTQVSLGDYVKAGSPLMRIGNLDWLKARFPFPETLLSRLQKGLPIRLSSPSAPGVFLETTVSEVRPSITFGSRAAQVIVNVENPGPWKPGASISGSVRVDLHKDAVLVPETSVVRRPAGTVVYVIRDGQAIQRAVQTGLRQEGRVEILSGLKKGEPVAVDGAGFLTDGARVEVKGS